MAEGYQMMAEEMAVLAEESLPLQAAATEKVWQWDEESSVLQHLGHLDEATMQAVDACLRVSLAL